MTQQQQRPLGITILAILGIIGGVLGILGGGCAAALGAVTGAIGAQQGSGQGFRGGRRVSPQL